jgi:hypothetical protein
MVGLLLSGAWYCAGVILFVGLMALLRPLPRLRLSTRRRAAKVTGAAAAAIIILALVPPTPTKVAGKTSRLDEVTPVYHYREVHARHVNATPDRVYTAVKATTAREIWLFQSFTWIRRFGQSGPESILNAPERMPILDVATRSGFALRADDPPRELVVSARVAPGVIAAMNFRIEPEGSGSRLSTETRVSGNNTRSIQRFTPYWRTILPGSWILRVTWLQAIARRAEMN